MKVKEAAFTVAAWVVSLFKHDPIVVGIRRVGRRRYTKGFVRGAMFMVPLIAGAAFEVLQADLPAVAAGAGTTVPAELGEVPTTESQTNWQVTRMAITAPTLVTGNATNSSTVNIRQMRAGAPVATIGTLALVAGVNLPAETPVAIPITGSPVLVAGDVLDVQVVQIGTGLAIPAGTNVKAEIS